MMAMVLAGIMLAGGCASRGAGNPGEVSSLRSEATAHKCLAPTGYLLLANSCKMSFEAAAEPYSHEVYNYDGYVNDKGEVVNGGLGCSGFVSIVLQRMRYGDSWQASYNSKLYQDYGDMIARKSGLPLVGTIDSSALYAPDKCRAFFESRGVNVGAILVFNVRKDVHGHVGFVQVMPGGKLAQFHYSGMEGYHGLAEGDFIDWYSRSMYRASSVELYGVTNDPLPEADGAQNTGKSKTRDSLIDLSRLVVL